MAGDATEVKQKTDIVSIISEHLELKKAGRNFKGLCPFHSEKTPSFIVSPELQIYKCFGCGESGDVFTFLQKHDSMDFSEALQFLADKAGVKLSKTNTRVKSEKESIYETNALAARLYSYILTKHKLGSNALNYLKKDRGLSMSSIEEFGLGFSPEETQVINDVMVAKKGVKKKDLVYAGIAYERGSRVYDRFTGRIIFPLKDHRGNICGFAGRILPDSKSKLAKYVNTPETPAYHKSNMFYALNIAKDYIKKENCAIIVEGELDVISMWQIGLKNTIAIKGSALTDGQASLIRRFSEKIILALDSDDAGQEAARKALSVSQKYELDVSVVNLGKFKDPDDAARSNPEKLKKMIDKAIPGWDFVLNLIFNKYSAETAPGKAKISKEISPILSQIEDKIVQAHYVNLVARKLKVGPDVVSEQISGKAQPVNPVERTTKDKRNRREILEERMLAILLHLDPKTSDKSGIMKLFENSLYKRIANKYDSYSKKAKFDLNNFGENLPNELRTGFINAMLLELDESQEKLNKELVMVIYELQVGDIKDELKKKSGEMKVLEGKGESDKMEQKKEEFNKLTQKLSEIKAKSLATLF